MRHICLLDNKITDEEFEKWRAEDETFWKQYIGVRPTYQVVRTDYTTYPTYIDADGDKRPTYNYLKSLNDQMVARYGEWAFDFLMVMVHEDNWQSDPPGKGGIWGTAYAYKFGKQTLQYCRWDKDNPANTFGTAYHERFHVFDSMTLVESGVDIAGLLGVLDFDAEVVHGKSPDWDYIRWKENTRALNVIAPHLRAAFDKRLQRHLNFLEKKRTLITLMEQAVYLFKMLLNRKNGIPR